MELVAKSMCHDAFFFPTDRWLGLQLRGGSCSTLACHQKQSKCNKGNAYKALYPCNQTSKETFERVAMKPSAFLTHPYIVLRLCWVNSDDKWYHFPRNCWGYLPTLNAVCCLFLGTSQDTDCPQSHMSKEKKNEWGHSLSQVTLKGQTVNGAVWSRDESPSSLTPSWVLKNWLPF